MLSRSEKCQVWLKIVNFFMKSWNCDVLSNVKHVHFHENGNFVTLFVCKKIVKGQIIGFITKYCVCM